MIKPKTFAGFTDGQQESKYIQIGFWRMTNCDAHSEVGTVRPQVDLEVDTDYSNVTEGCKEIVVGADVYHFSLESGKIWKNNTLVHTNAQGTNVSACHFVADDSAEFIYYASDTKLGVYTISTNTFSDGEQSLNSGGHPMVFFDKILYIGNKSLVAIVDKLKNFANDALDLPQDLTIQDIAPYSTALRNDLIVAMTGRGKSWLFRWDTTSSSWVAEDPVPEENVYALLEIDNALLAIAESGTLYAYSGRRLEAVQSFEPFTPAPQPTSFRKRRPIFFSGTKIYSVYRRNANYNRAVIQEYTLPSPIFSINGDRVCTGSGVYKFSDTRAIATLVTPMVIGKASEVRVGYQQRDGDIEIWVKKDNEDTFIKQAVRNDDENRREVVTDVTVGAKRECQIQVIFSGDTIIENITIR